MTAQDARLPAVPRTGKQIGVLVAGIAALILVATGVLDVGPFARLPHEWQLLAVTVLFGAALLVQDSSRRNEITKLSTRRASVRPRIYWKPDDYGKHQASIVFENKGEMEARRIRLQPVTDRDYPWQFEIEEIGSLFRSDSPVTGRVKRSVRPGLTCESCSGPPDNLREFLFELPRHRAHAIKNTESTKPEDREYWVRAAAGIMDVALPLIVTYADELERPMTATHRLLISVREEEPDARIEFESQSDPSRR